MIAAAVSGAGEDVVLLHGVGLDRTLWDRVTPLLDKGFRVTVVDLRGHGQSPLALPGTTLTELSDDVLEVLDREGVGRAHLVGFSLGALVAQRLVIDHPDRVASLALVSSVADRTAVERAAVLDRLDVARTSRLATIEAAVDRWFSSEWAAAEPGIVKQVRETLLATDGPSYLACYEVFATGDAEVWPGLGQIDAPTLVVTGDLDPGSTPDMAARLGEAIPHVTVEVFPDTRHLLPLERPDALSGVLHELFERTRA